MPFNRTDPMKERTKFILAWEKRWQESQGGRIDVAELCRVFGISRDTGYTWIRRYREANHDLTALEERSRRPHSSPTATAQPIQDFIVGARKARPRWGPRKLRAWLVDRYPGRSFPSAATFATILKRHGLTTPRRKGRRRVPGAVEPFAPASAPNSVWCIDFKGHFRTSDGDKCLPMTVVDAFSRYCLRCEVVRETSYEHAQWVLDSAFREFGLPAAIRSDNGPPFAARGPAGLSRLAVWLLRLAIRVERIQPGKPQQNGRLERFHRTLKAETASPPERNLRAQQRAFDLFRADYNHERPHEALANKVPASQYVPSTRRYPCPLVQPATGSFAQVLTVDQHGFIRWGRHRVFVSAALACERVEVLPDGETGWFVQFGPLELGRFDDQHPNRGLQPKPRPRRDNYLQL
jgi:transposase InsO family protein